MYDLNLQPNIEEPPASADTGALQVTKGEPSKVDIQLSSSLSLKL